MKKTVGVVVCAILILSAALVSGCGIVQSGMDFARDTLESGGEPVYETFEIPSDIMTPAPEPIWTQPPAQPQDTLPPMPPAGAPSTPDDILSVEMKYWVVSNSPSVPSTQTVFTLYPDGSGTLALYSMSDEQGEEYPAAQMPQIYSAEFAYYIEDFHELANDIIDYGFYSLPEEFTTEDPDSFSYIYITVETADGKKMSGGPDADAIGPGAYTMVAGKIFDIMEDVYGFEVTYGDFSDMDDVQQDSAEDTIAYSFINDAGLHTSYVLQRNGMTTQAIFDAQTVHNEVTQLLPLNNNAFAEVEEKLLEYDFFSLPSGLGEGDQKSVSISASIGGRSHIISVPENETPPLAFTEIRDEIFHALQIR